MGKFRATLFSAFGLLLMLSYQNCSNQVDFATDEALLAANIDDQNSPDIIDDSLGELTPPNIPYLPDGPKFPEDNDPNGEPPHEGDNQAGNENQDDLSRDDSNKDRHCGTDENEHRRPGRVDMNPPNQDDRGHHNNRGEVDEPALVAICDQLKESKKIIQLEDEAAINNIRGKNAFKIKALSEVKQVSGRLAIIGVVESSKIDLIEQVNGNILICNAKVKKLKNVNGNVTIVNGNLRDEDIENFNGILRIINPLGIASN